jgi:hypothetical protein
MDSPDFSAALQAGCVKKLRPPAFCNAGGREIFPMNQFRLTPAGSDPNGAVRALFPMSAHPEMTRMRMIPVSANPNPAAAPFPNAANPDESRVGGDRNDFDLRLRRFARLFHHNFVAGWRLSDVDDTARLTFNNTACKQRQAGGDYDSFD